MKPSCTFTVVPSLPDRLARLRDLAHNLRWAWHHNAINLLPRLDVDATGKVVKSLPRHLDLMTSFRPRQIDWANTLMARGDNHVVYEGGLR